MAGPWEQYQSSPANDGPWAQYQPTPTPTSPTQQAAPPQEQSLLSKVAPYAKMAARLSPVTAPLFWGESANTLGEKVTDYATSKGLTPETSAKLGVAANVGMNALPMLMSMGTGSGLSNEEVARNALNSQKQKVLESGQNLGLKIPPTTANPSAVNRLVESIGGKAATAQEASAANEGVIYAAGQRAAGLQPNQAITEESLAAARNAAAAPYREVAKLSPKAAAELENWQNANQEAKLAWNEFGKMGSRQAFKDAKAAEVAREAALDAIEKEGAGLGKSGLADSLKAARVQIAKIHTIEDAMRGSSFNAQALARALDKGVPLSGDLKTIGQFAQDFPKAVAPPQVGGSVGVSQLFPFLGGTAGSVGGALVNGAHGAGLGAAAGIVAGQALPPAARALALSQWYQSLMTGIPQVAEPISPALMTGLVSAPQGALYRR